MRYSWPNRHTTWLVIVPLLFIISLIGVTLANHNQAEAPSVGASTKATGQSGKGQTTGFNNKVFSIDDPRSLWVVVNKRRPLNPTDYAPELTTPPVALRLSKEASEMQVSNQMAPALLQLFQAAEAAGVPLMLASGYRSYSQQVAVYGAEVKNYGGLQADRESARPGHSEHQTGLAADLEPVNRQCEIAQCFGQLPEGKWLVANAASYGFIIRYPENKEQITGYMYEPWHVRYVGLMLAKELESHADDTLETFFKLPAAAVYP